MKQFNPIVTIPSRIIFQEPTIQHPRGNETVAEVAKDLEEKFSPLHIFYDKYKDKMKSVIIQEVKRAWNSGRDQETVNDIISRRITNLWRMFILRDETGIKTRASKQRGNQSFVDTGAYYKQMKVKVK